VLATQQYACRHNGYLSPDSSTGVVSAPLWNSEESKFAGMLTVLDIIHLIQFYHRTTTFDSATADVEHFRLGSLRGRFEFFSYQCNSSRHLEIEQHLGVAPPPLLREHPSSSLYAAAKLLIQTHARRVPLLDKDSETGHEVIVSTLTQYRLLKFIAINVRVPAGFTPRVSLLI
jgi:5'-AMP-activated protein kinase, regulatory gamma subunit